VINLTWNVLQLEEETGEVSFRREKRGKEEDN
jgi:hypothetical protein